MASIDFTHALAGAQTLQSSRPSPLDRFQNWTPFVKSIGPEANELGSGRLHRFEHRPDACASFELAGIDNGAGLVVAQLLQHHLLSGGTCSVITDDLSNNTYPTCGLAPGTEPEITFDDRQMLEYRFRVTLVNVDPTLTLLTCSY